MGTKLGNPSLSLGKCLLIISLGGVIAYNTFALFFTSFALIMLWDYFAFTLSLGSLKKIATLWINHLKKHKKSQEAPFPHFRDYDDTTVEHRAYNQRRGEMLLRLFLAETGKNHLLAEDLGESPAYVTESLKKLQIPGFKIPLWTRDETGHMLPEKYRC